MGFFVFHQTTLQLTNVSLQLAITRLKAEKMLVMMPLDTKGK